jgi:hypothetical protein
MRVISFLSRISAKRFTAVERLVVMNGVPIRSGKRNPDGKETMNLIKRGILFTGIQWAKNPPRNGPNRVEVSI